LGLPVVIRGQARFRPQNGGMKNERMRDGDVRRLDGVGLLRAVIAGDPEAFAELMRRFDPVVRAQVARVTPKESIDEEIAEFWCGLIGERFAPLQGWEPDGGLLAQWISFLAAQACRRQSQSKSQSESQSERKTARRAA
jgi:hypothetical protein